MCCIFATFSLISCDFGMNSALTKTENLATLFLTAKKKVLP